MFAALRATRTAASARAFSTTPKPQLARMTLVGRLGVAPEEVTISNDRTLVKYVIGSSYGKGDDKKTSWFRVASFVEGRQKEFLLNQPKGALVHVDADARMESYTDAQGNQRTNLSLIARSFDVISRPRVEEHPETNEEGVVQ